MKKITLISLSVLFPVVSCAQGFDLSEFDSSQVSVCTTADAVCVQKNAELRVLVQTLLVQVLAKIAAQEKALIDSVKDKGDVVQDNVDLHAWSQPAIEEGDTVTFRIKDKAIRGLKTEDHPLIGQMWDLFLEILPTKYHDLFDRYELYNDPDQSTAASVLQSATTRGPRVLDEDWELHINVAYASLLTDQDRERMITLLAHETAHVLVLHTEQFTHDSSDRECDNYYSAGLRACSKNDSYITDFSDWWSSSYLDWVEDHADLAGSSRNQEQSQAMLNDYYHSNQDQFVSRYAVTNPTEDIAESITHFVTENIPTGQLQIKDEKILYFFDFDEMIKLRTQVQKLLP